MKPAANTLSANPSKSPDQEAIQTVLTAYVTCWNKHDIDSWGRLFTEDVDYINPVGTWWEGNQATVDCHKSIHAELVSSRTTYRASIAKVRLLGDIALVHANWILTREQDESKGLLSLLMLKRNARWLICAAQNTITIDD